MSRAARARCLALALASIASVGFLGSVNASVVTVSGSALSFGSTNNSNDVIHTQQGYFGANLYLDTAATITFTYLGYEAGYQNKFFQLANTAVFTTGVSALNASQSFAINPGLIAFKFTTSNGGGPVLSVSDGANTGYSANAPGFFVSFGTFDSSNHFTASPINHSSPYTSGTQGIIAFDDGGATPNDKDYDDLVVKFVVQGGGSGNTPAVPEASTWAMMILGFLGVGLVAYRRKTLDVGLRAA
jgi:hypothetical protein